MEKFRVFEWFERLKRKWNMERIILEVDLLRK
jgi:hypothetical protein